MKWMRQLARQILCRSTPGYLFYMRLIHGVGRPAGRPAAPWHNAVLQNKRESDEALSQVKALGLPPHGDAPKNWDSLAALDVILSRVPPTGRILDAGATRYSVLLPWLALYGYRKLRGINLEFDGESRLGPIRFEQGDLTRIACPDAHFDAVSCMSVIEHGVDLESYFSEMSRVLKPGGALITSTDYWCEPLVTSGKNAYGAPVKIFSQAEIEEALVVARRYGLVATAPPELGCGDKVVSWAQFDLEFTFLVVTLQKAT